MLPRRHYNLCIQYMNKELIISVTQSISPGSGSGRSGRTGLLIPAGHGVQLDGVHSLHDGLGSGDRDLSLIIRFVLLRIQTTLTMSPCPAILCASVSMAAEASINKSSAFKMCGNMLSSSISAALRVSSSVSPAVSSDRSRDSRSGVIRTFEALGDVLGFTLQQARKT